jgi:general secretion pathway protein I
VSARPRRRGFTLIEVLVALAIAAIGLASVLAIVTNTARNASSLRDRTFAGWIAANRVTETRLEQALPSVDRTAGDVDYAGQKWRWERTVTQTQVPGLRRVDVRVRYAAAADDAWLVTLSGFVGKTQLASTPSGTTWLPIPGAPPQGGTPPPSQPADAQ